MKYIGITTNRDKDKGLAYTAELIKWLYGQECVPLVTEGDHKLTGSGEVCGDKELYEKADLMLVLGGDGTILRAARHAALYGLPVLGINFGTLGYLADVDRADAKTAIKAVLDGNYTVEERMLLEAVHIHDFKEKGRYLALNEVYVSNALSLNLVNLEMSINDSFINVFRADGIMVATPTGSTAYNLSAGGPILKPDTRLMAINSVCPHNLYFRPFVISGEDCVTIKILDSGNMIFSLDGEERVPVQQNDDVKITGSDLSVKIIKTSKRNFYDTLRYKMMGN
ncbi:MAG: NAD(+)/NADH kinase [Firmicutes bacterium]|nr:NAD(+)/NADH kinase [Bacillota bacterium]